VPSISFYLAHSVQPDTGATKREPATQSRSEERLGEAEGLTISDDRARRGTRHESSHDVRHGIHGPNGLYDPNEGCNPSVQEEPSGHESTPNGGHTIPSSRPPKYNPAPGKPGWPRLLGPAWEVVTPPGQAPVFRS